MFGVIFSLDEGVSITLKQNFTFLAFNFSAILLVRLHHVATYSVMHLPLTVTKKIIKHFVLAKRLKPEKKKTVRGRDAEEENLEN